MPMPSCFSRALWAQPKRTGGPGREQCPSNSHHKPLHSPAAIEVLPQSAGISQALCLFWERHSGMQH